jgi:lysophospholipase L1-like esterase
VKKLLASLILLLTSGLYFSASAQEIGYAPTTSGIVYQTQRNPLQTDGSGLGYTTSSLWQYGGSFWYNTSVSLGKANWQNIPPISGQLCDVVPTCLFAYGVYHLKQGYAGNAFNVTRASDSTSLDIGFVNGVADWSSADTFCYNTTCSVGTWYDQSGNGYDLTQGTVASQPLIRNTLVGSQKGISFLATPNFFANTSVAVTNRNNVSVLLAARENGTGFSGTTWWELGSPTQKLSMYGGLAWTQGLCMFDTAQRCFGAYNDTLIPKVSLVVVSSGAATAWNNNLHYSGPSISSSSSTGLLFGTSTLTGAFSAFDVASLVGWNGALTAAQQNTARQQTMDRLSIKPQVTDNILFLGDSITCCTVSGTAPSLLSGYVGQTEALLNHPVNVYDIGQNGAQSSAVAGAAGVSSSTFVSGARNVGIFFAGTNDIFVSSQSGASVYANMKTACATLHTNGYKCIVASPLARTGSGPQETQRQALETLLVAGWGTFADGFVDLTADPVMGPSAAASNSALYGDGVHPTPLGASYVASDMASGLSNLLP